MRIFLLKNNKFSVWKFLKPINFDCLSRCFVNFLRKDTHFIGGKMSLDQNNSTKLLHYGPFIVIFCAINSLIFTNKIKKYQKVS